MKYWFRRIVVSLGFSLTVMVGRVSAQSLVECGSLPEQFDALRELLIQITSLGTAVAVLLAVMMLIYAGVLMIRGTPQSVEKAKRIIVYTIGGLVLVFIAGGMVEWVANILCQPGGV
mgnify:CR=1 FL=1